MAGGLTGWRVNIARHSSQLASVASGQHLVSNHAGRLHVERPQLLLDSVQVVHLRGRKGLHMPAL